MEKDSLNTTQRIDKDIWGNYTQQLRVENVSRSHEHAKAKTSLSKLDYRLN